jgi:hypothetical protein
VDRVEAGIEILTGVEAGARDASGHFPPGSVNARVEARLRDFARRRRRFAREDDAEEADGDDA